MFCLSLGGKANGVAADGTVSNTLGVNEMYIELN